MPKRALVFLSSLLSLSACSTPSVSGTDAGSGNTDGGGSDSSVGPADGWHEATALPEAVAFGAAMVLPSSGTDYVYVIGGADGSFGDLGTLRGTILRAPIQSDHSLGAWETAGDITPGTGAAIPLAGHGAIRIWGETGADGVAIAGGGTLTSALPFVLGGYVQFDGSLGEWGRFDPMLSSGQSFGSFNPFEAHQLALIGGLEGTTPSARVMIAAIENGSMSPTWRSGPSLPAPRFGHGSAVADGEVYLVGGTNDDGNVADILRTSRDATLEVTEWVVAGTLDAPVGFPGVGLVEHRLFVMGGIDGDPTTGTPTTRVRIADIDPTSHDVGAFTDAEALPVAIGAPMVAIDGAYIYLVGGLGTDLSASTSVVYGRLP